MHLPVLGKGVARESGISLPVAAQAGILPTKSLHGGRNS